MNVTHYVHNLIVCSIQAVYRCTRTLWGGNIFADISNLQSEPVNTMLYKGWLTGSKRKMSAINAY